MIFIKIETIGTATKMTETTSKNTQNGWTNLMEIETNRNCGCLQRAFTVYFLCKVELMLGKHICLKRRAVILSFTSNFLVCIANEDVFKISIINKMNKLAGRDTAPLN